jgi:hypothetical protein
VVTQVGKAPPSPEMMISGLTRGRLVGDDDVAKQTSIPGFAGRAARPFGGLFRFWAVFSYESQITLRHRSRSRQTASRSTLRRFSNLLR